MIQITMKEIKRECKPVCLFAERAVNLSLARVNSSSRNDHFHLAFSEKRYTRGNRIDVRLIALCENVSMVRATEAQL